MSGLQAVPQLDTLKSGPVLDAREAERRDIGEHREPRRNDVPRRASSLRPADAAILAGAVLASGCLTWVLHQVTPLRGAPGFVLLWFVAFAVLYWLVVREVEGRLAATDRLATVLVLGGSFMLLVPLVLIIGYVLVRGLPYLGLNTFTQTREFAGPLSGPEEGGALHAIVGTLEQVGLAMAMSVPLGILTAVFLNEVGGPLARPVRLFTDAMSGLPSIIAGLFVFALWLETLGNKFSGFAASMALAVLMLPSITRTAEVVLRLVPGGLREAALALGSPEWKVTWRVVLPTARTGVVTAVILGVARAVGETAPLLFTAFGADVLNANPFANPQDSLPLYVYDQIRFGSIDGDVPRALAGIVVLVLLVLILFTLARVLSRADSGR